MRQSVSNYIKTCHTCQVVGKPNQKIPKAPLKPIPAFGEPFSHLIIDCVGPLPKSKSGNEYLLTIMCSSTRFPEAIPLRNIKAKTILKVLIKFFTLVGLPKSIQSDRGSNFMSGLFQQVLHELNIEQLRSSVYHPESQGALERFHQTLKTMLRSFCLESGKDWDEGVHLLLFAARESVQESLGFSPFELVFGHTVRGPLKLLKDKFMEPTHNSLNLLDYVSTFKSRLLKANELAHNNLKIAQCKMKARYDQNSVSRNFKTGEKVLVLFPVSGKPLHAKYYGPYAVDRKVNEQNYIINTPDRRKDKQLCHINLLKPYYSRDNHFISVVASDNDNVIDPPTENSSDICEITVDNVSLKLNNSDILNNINCKIAHLELTKRGELTNLIYRYANLFPDIPSRTNVLHHDVDVGSAKPIKQHPYRINPEKREYLKKEIQYLLESDLIEPSTSSWSSPCVLIPKPDGSYRLCTDYRKVNEVTVTDSYPIPRIDDCIDNIGSSKFISKFDLLKGFYQVPLTEKAKEISAFVTPDGLYQYKVMPFGMKNSPASFQRLVNILTADIPNCEVYIDDAVIFTNSWEEHLEIMETFFRRLSNANLTINLAKSEFCCATVVYLGHVIGQGQVRPINAKIKSISEFPVPNSRKQLMRFLGMAGYYRKFCPNFATISEPLTNLLSKKKTFNWDNECQQAFTKLKAILETTPVLSAPNFNIEFKLYVDASDVGAGAMLVQPDPKGVDKPIAYFSKKFNKHQKNYSVIEKECLALILALQHFEVYVSNTNPVTVYTDHNPLKFISKMKTKNQKILRWSLYLQNFNLQIEHVKGRLNVIADSLSRGFVD